MLLDPRDWALAPAIDEVLAALAGGARATTSSSETHSSRGRAAHRRAHDRRRRDRRARRAARPAERGARRRSAWPPRVCGHAPVGRLARDGGLVARAPPGGLRLDARARPPRADVRAARPRRPAAGEAGIAAFNRLRAHIPVLLALSANSPFWQGRDTGLASARTPLFQAFPRVGIPRAFGSYGEYVRAVNLLLDCGAFPDPTYLWWDVRPQPKLGTVEVRIMDAQSTLDAHGGARRARAVARAPRARRRATPTPRSCTRPRCSTRTASSPRATASRPSSSIRSAGRAVPGRRRSSRELMLRVRAARRRARLRRAARAARRPARRRRPGAPAARRQPRRPSSASPPTSRWTSARR